MSIHLDKKMKDLEEAKFQIAMALDNIKEHEEAANALFQLEFANEKLHAAIKLIQKWQ
tara:strand:+ start:2041 stop:2214 length:174 start_codon:yes stop_codon:yes gene_type:complete